VRTFSAMESYIYCRPYIFCLERGQGAFSNADIMGAAFLSNLRDDFRPSQLFPSFITGLVIGMLMITITIAFAALIYSDAELAPYRSDGIGLMLFGGIIFGGLTALLSSFRGLATGLQDSPAAILSVVATAIVAAMPSSATPKEIFLTVVAAVALTTISTGLLFIVLGQFKLGNLVRFMPYPVLGGFLAGTGLLLLFGTFGFVTGQSVSLMNLSPAIDPDLVIKWVPSLIFAIALFLAIRRYHHFLVVPGVIMAGIVLFYVILALSGSSVSEAQDEGWLLNALPEGKGGGLWQPYLFTDLDKIDWPVMADQIGSIGGVVLISIVALLLNITAIELATKENLELNRELKAAGLSNVIAGLGGSSVGYHLLSPSVLAHQLGGKTRLVGIFMAFWFVVVLVAGESLLAYFPNPVIGGLLFFVSLNFLIDWVYATWFTLPKTDYAIVILIMVAINVFGFLEGVGIGLGLTVLLFVVQYSRINVVKHTLSGSNYQSNVVRATMYQGLLRQKGERIYILKLQGFIFFGTAHKLFEQIRERVHESGVRLIVFDFRLVTGLDSSAVLSFAKIKQLAQEHDIVLVFAGLSPNIHRQLTKEILQEKEADRWRVFPDLDHAVEWCEDQLIQTLESVGLEANPKTLRKQLEEAMDGPAQVQVLMQYLDCEEVEAGHMLIRQGEPPSHLTFIERGQVTVQLELGNGKTIRLRKMNAGTLVGELGMYLKQPATASVITEQPSTLYHLTMIKLDRMQAENPEVAAAFHRFMAGFLAERLTYTTNTLRALVD